MPFILSAFDVVNSPLCYTVRCMSWAQDTSCWKLWRRQSPNSLSSSVLVPLSLPNLLSEIFSYLKHNRRRVRKMFLEMLVGKPIFTSRQPIMTIVGHFYHIGTDDKHVPYVSLPLSVALWIFCTIFRLNWSKCWYKDPAANNNSLIYL